MNTQAVAFSFVILNYRTYDFTCACIKSIQEQCSEREYRIVIVDNASPDNSGKRLQETFAEDERIHIIFNQENAGFAKGNNLGIAYAREHFQSKFVIVNNSDTLVLTPHFLEKIENIYEQNPFAILGPKVSSSTDRWQHKPRKMYTLTQVKRSIWRYRIRWLLNAMYLTKLDDCVFEKRKTTTNTQQDSPHLCKNMVISGCFFVFSEQYFAHYAGIPEDTKFYCEEELLYIQCQTKGLTILYDPQVEIFHHAGEAVSASYRDRRKRNLFKMHQLCLANQALYKKMKDTAL